MTDIADEAEAAAKAFFAIVDSLEDRAAELMAAAIKGGEGGVRLALERIVSEQQTKLAAVAKDMAAAAKARKERSQQSPSDKLN
jgi:hypothetical protein